MKPIYACSRCGKSIAVTPEDPVITASSLGAGLFHRKCASEVWAEKASKRPSLKPRRGSSKRSKPSEDRPRSNSCSCGEPIDSSTGATECRFCIDDRQRREEQEA